MEDQGLPKKILMVEDDQAFAKTIETALAKYNVAVVLAPQLTTALYHYNNQRFDVALIEVEFAELPGLAIIQKWRNHEVVDKRFTGFIAMTSLKRTTPDESLIKELGDVEVVAKPFTATSILSILMRAVAGHKRAIEAHEQTANLLDFYHKTANVEKTIQLLEKKRGVLGERANEILVGLYETANRLDEALAIATKQSDANQNDIAALNRKGRILMKLGRFAEAAPIMERADQIAPMNIERVTALADMYINLNQPEKTVKKFNELVRLNPETPDLKFDLMDKLYSANMGEQGKMFARENAGPHAGKIQFQIAVDPRTKDSGGCDIRG